MEFVKRPSPSKALVIFIHGFTGKPVETWANFPTILREDPDLQGFDFLFWGYPTSVNFLYTITRFFWTDDPNIKTVGQALRSLLEEKASGYDTLVLVGHSMGGLVIQSFVLEELIKKRPKHLDRLTEIVLYGTPSGGLEKAGWGIDRFVTQVENMTVSGEFIVDLRRQWKLWVDDSRVNADRLSRFKLTVVAGMKDKFVPQTSSLDPFPLDEKLIVPGNHISMIKPSSADDLCYSALKRRLLRGTPNANQRRHLAGESAEMLAKMNRVRAASELGDLDDLLAQAKEAIKTPVTTTPRVDRELGMALLDQQRFAEAAKLLARYVDFAGDGDDRPFHGDAEATQQLAIALSGTGDFISAVARLKELDPRLLADPESQGILAGRFKRMWLKKPESVQLGWRSYQIYKSAFEAARAVSDHNQTWYNGINAAYMSFAMGSTDFEAIARAVLIACDATPKPDYWSEVSRAEAYLVLRDYPKAEEAYRSAHHFAPSPRERATSGSQALDILNRQGRPQEGNKIAELFQDIRLDS